MKPIHLHTEADRAGLLRFIQTLDLTKPWRVEIKRPPAKRTLSQNALFHKWCGEVAAETGYDPEEAKHWLKVVCACPPTIIEINGEKIQVRSTACLKKHDMTEFMDRVYRKVAGEMGIFLTLPDAEHIDEKAA